MANVDYSVDELVSLLKKTNLPTIVVEGSDDIIIFRHLEDRLSKIGVDVLPAKGRSKLLQVFERRMEFMGSKRVAFIADRDTWVNTGIPPSFCDNTLIFTDGYSIENDVFRDGNLESLLVTSEREIFARELELFISWYSIALARYLVDGTEKIDLHPNQVFQDGCLEKLLIPREGECSPEELKNELKSNYARLIRGKSLLNLLVRQTTRPGRQPSHKSQALLEFVAARPGQHLRAIEERVSICLS